MSLSRAASLVPPASRYVLVALLLTSAVLKIHFLALDGHLLPSNSRTVYTAVAVLEVTLSALMFTRFAVRAAVVLVAGVTGAALVTAVHAFHGASTAECHCLGKNMISIWQSLALQGLLLFLGSVWVLGQVGAGDA